MSQKPLVLLLALGMVSVANAEVISVVAYDAGWSDGRTGTSTDPLLPGDQIGLDIILRHNPYPGLPSYDGYNLACFGVSLEVSGPGQLYTGVNKNGPVISFNSGLDLTLWSEEDSDMGKVTENIIHQIFGASMLDLPAQPNDIWLVSALYLICEGEGVVNIDLSLNDISQYSPYYDANSGGGPYPDPPGWINMVEEDLGDLMIYQEVPPVWPECWDETQCYGDANGDGFVDTEDWPPFRDSFGKCYPDPEYDPCADYNRDGCVNTEDFPPFRDSFGKSVPQPGDPICIDGGTWPPI